MDKTVSNDWMGPGEITKSINQRISRPPMQYHIKRDELFFTRT